MGCDSKMRTNAHSDFVHVLHECPLGDYWEICK
jgi:hypothetical protein